MALNLCVWGGGGEEKESSGGLLNGYFHQVAWCSIPLPVRVPVWDFKALLGLVSEMEVHNVEFRIMTEATVG